MKKRKRLTLLFSFLVPLIIVMGYFIYRKFAPFGSSSIMTVDMGQQYIDFFAYFKNTILHDPGAFFYSFSKALGGDMIGTWAYYLMSPLNLLILLFPISKLPSVLAIITILKYGFSGLTFSYLLIKTGKINSFLNVAFSTTYAFMGWMVANQLNILWLDGVILLPLVFLGLQKIMHGQSKALYIIALTAILIINYYIAWMIAIFISAYIILFSIFKAYKADSYLKVLGNWLGASLISGALSSWMLIPTYYSLLVSKAKLAKPAMAFAFEYNPFHMIAKFFNGAFDFTQMPTGTPNIFVGSLIVILCLYYFFDRKINWREKLANGLLALFIIVSFFFMPLDVFWHGLALPVWYPYRFSFVFSFLMIFIAFKSLQSIAENQISWKNMVASLTIVAAGFIYVLIFLKSFKFLSMKNLIIGLVFIILVTAGLFFWSKTTHKILASGLLAGLVIIEMSTNMALSLNNITYLTNDSFTKFVQILDTATNKTKKMDPSFYRIASTFNRTRNDPLTANFHGGSVFSSTLETATTNFYNNIGNPSSMYYAVFSNGTMFTDSLLGMKYYFTPRANTSVSNFIKLEKYTIPLTGRPDIKNYQLVDHSDVVNIYKNPFALPLGFLSNTQIMFPINSNTNTAEYQNTIAQQIDPQVGQLFDEAVPSKTQFSNMQSVPAITNAQFNKIHPTEPASLTMTFKVQPHTSYYMSLGPLMTQDLFLYQVNGVTLPQYRSSAKETLLNFASGTNKPRTVKLTVEALKNHAEFNNVLFYALDNNKVSQFAHDMKQNSFKVNHYTDRTVSGTITSPTPNRTMLTTIPYSTGWHVSVDGQKVTPHIWANMFMKINVDQGTHQVTFSYWPAGFNLGLFITGLTALLLIITHFIKFPKVLKIKKDPNKPVKSEGK